MPWSLRYRLAAAALTLLALAPAASVAQAQKKQQPDAKAKIAPQSPIVGLPIYTSDGKPIGKVIATGVDEDDEPVLVGEIARSLGIGPQAIAIPSDLFLHKRGRIELTITEAEVNARLGRNR